MLDKIERLFYMIARSGCTECDHRDLSPNQFPCSNCSNNNSGIHKFHRSEISNIVNELRVIILEHETLSYENAKLREAVNFRIDLLNWRKETNGKQ